MFCGVSIIVHPSHMAHGESMNNTTHFPEPARIGTTIGRRSFATLATVSPAGRPHVAGVLYEAVDQHLYVNTLRTSRKARNIAAERHVGICVPVRRLPVGPPSTVHFQTTADLLDVDDAAITELLERGLLASVTGHGELDLPESSFIRIALPNRMLTHGLGMPLRTLIKDPLAAGGLVALDSQQRTFAP